jgi:serine/threonine-protein kinase ATR
LQCAFDDRKLLDDAFIAWASLVRAVDAEDLEQLIDQTLSIVAQYWPAFRTETQEVAHELVSSLFNEHDAILKERIESLPSLSSITVLSKLANDINRRKTALDVSIQYGGYLQRLQDENTVVVVQALRELKPFLETNQQFLHESAVSQKPSQVVSQLARSLMDARMRFNHDNGEIISLCVEALGILGCIDPNRVEAVREKKDIVVLSNFEREIEAIDFAAHLLEQVLVKCFHSAANARAQGFIAWAMQELLRFCKFNTTALQQGRGTQSSLYRRWVEMSESTRSTLTPFLSSSYSVQDYSALLADGQAYPIFNESVNHSAWLRSFTLDLLRKGGEGNAQMIFTTIARIIRNHDLSIATFILPFAALNVIIGGSDQEIANLGNEMLFVLEYERQESDGCTVDDLKQCSEVSGQLLCSSNLSANEISEHFPNSRLSCEVVAGETKSHR